MIIVFDAHCLLCSASVRFILRHDRKQVFRFTSAHSQTGAALLQQAGIDAAKLNTMLLVDGSRCHVQSAALLQILHQLGFPWRLAWLAWLIPRPLRDALYRLIARNRYRIFGRADTCFLPDAAWRSRFID